MKMFLPVIDVMNFDIDNREYVFNVGDFCDFIKKNSCIGENFIRQVLEKYGKSSEEFLFCVQGLVWWVVNKYGWYQYVSEDVFNTLYLEILEKIDNFDMDKGSLLNYLHTIVRGGLTKELHKNNMVNRFFVDLDLDKDKKCKFDLSDMDMCFLEWKDILWIEYEEGDKYDTKYLVLVLCLTKLLNLDIRIMKYLFNKFGVDVLYFFYMLAGKQVNVWKCDRLGYIVEQVLQRYEGKDIKSKYVQKIVDVVVDFLNKNDKKGGSNG